ncbi:unnamed protein product, partial [Symbiodinium sp. KB8]
MASEEPTLETSEPTLEVEEPPVEEAQQPPLSSAELRLLRLLLTRAAQPQLCLAHTVDFDRPPQPVHVRLEPLLAPTDFDLAGFPRPPPPTLTGLERAFFTFLRWIIKALLGAFGDMAPKKLEPLPPGVSPATLVSEETVADRPEFRTFRRWYSPQQFLETLRSGGFSTYFILACTGQDDLRYFGPLDHHCLSTLMFLVRQSTSTFRCGRRYTLGGPQDNLAAHARERAAAGAGDEGACGTSSTGTQFFSFAENEKARIHARERAAAGKVDEGGCGTASTGTQFFSFAEHDKELGRLTLLSQNAEGATAGKGYADISNTSHGDSNEDA